MLDQLFGHGAVTRKQTDADTRRNVQLLLGLFERLREVRKSGRDGRLIAISAVDPLNLTGVLTSADRVRSMTSSRLVYRDGVALAALEGDYVRPLADIDASVAGGLATALAGRPLPAVTSGFVGR